MVVYGYMKIFLLLLSVYVLELNAKKNNNSRKLMTKFICPEENGPCPVSKNGTFINVAYTKAVGPNDTFHYIVSSFGTPSILVARTDLGSVLTVNWTKLFSTDPSDALTFFPTPKYVYSLVFSRLLEYNDVNDKASLDKVSQNLTYWKMHELSSLHWLNSSVTSDIDQHVIALRANRNSTGESFIGDGSLSFEFTIYGTEGRASRLPHLAYTVDSAQFDFILDRINTSFDNSRFALEMAFVAEDKNSSNMDIVTTKSIDDEHTPGVFELFDWVSNSKNKSIGSYIQWKPVCYTLPKRDITAITKAKNYPVRRSNITKSDLGDNLAYMYFGDKMFEANMSLTMTNVSFGLAKDKFYNLNKYSVWSASVGYGKPPEDEISTMLIVVILCGIGIPAVLLIFGGIGVCVKKRRERYVGYQDLSRNDVIVNT